MMPPEVQAVLDELRVVRRRHDMCSQSITCPRRAKRGFARCEQHINGLRESRGVESPKRNGYRKEPRPLASNPTEGSNG